MDFADYQADREHLLQEVIASGCAAVINPGIDIPTSHASLELSAQHTQIYAAVGIHPHEAIHYLTSGDDVFDFLFRDIRTLEGLASKPKVVAIGECGLDYYRIQADDAERSRIVSMQRELLTQQLAVATKKKLPVILHIRDAHQDILDLLDREAYTGRGVAHCYDGDWIYTETLLAMDFCIGFTANITYPKKESIHEQIKKIPLERIVLETDSPFLSPQAKRGQRNDPRSVRAVAQTIADITSLPLSDVIAQTTKNAIQLFGLPFEP